MSIIETSALEPSVHNSLLQPMASAVVCTRNRGSQITSTVRSILDNHYPNFELILVDQSTNDESAMAVAPYLDDPHFHYIRTATKGLGLSRDIGLRAAKGEFVLITDDDCDVPVDWIMRQVEAFLSYPEVAVIHCDVLPGPCDYTKGYIAATSVTTHNFRIKGLGLKEIQSIGIGASISVRRSVALKLGGFDPGLGAGTVTSAGEDTDVSLKALLNGYHLYHLHDVQVIHHGFRSYDEARGLLRGYMFGAGATYGKLLKCGYWQMLRFLPLLYWDALVPQIITDLKRFRIPRVFGRTVYLTKGVLFAMRTPVDRSRQVFKV